MPYSHACLFVGSDAAAVRAYVDAIVGELVPAGYQLDAMRLAPELDKETGKLHDISIDETKRLKHWISLRPTGTHKVVVIEHAERLGDEAANNLLKVLEEPPSYAHFFLLTSRPGQVLATVISRCERVDVASSGVASSVTPQVRALGAAIKGSVADKIAYAKKLAENPEAITTVRDTLAYIHGQLGTRSELAPVAHGLMDLLVVLEQPQFNRRLAIESFLLSVQIM